MLSREQHERPRLDWWLAAALFVLTAALYARSVTFDFVNYDDSDYVVDNRRVQAGLTWAGVKWAFTTGEASNWHPMTWLSLMADVSIYGNGPAGHHATNVLLHAANAALLFVALRRSTGDVWPAAACAALFAWHPLRAESVAWVSERKDVLSGLFWMLTLVAYERYARNPGVGRYLAVAAALAMGLMSKPMLVTLPFVLLLLDFWPLRRWNPLGRPEGAPTGNSWRPVVEKLPLIAMVAAASVVTFLVQQAGRSVSRTEHVPMLDRLGNAAISTIVYLRQTVWPAGLAPFYPHPRSIPGESVDWAMAALCAAAIAAGCLAAVAWLRRAPWFAVGWFWYLGTLVPVIGIVQVGEQAHADRYTYLPVIGVTIAAAWTVAALVRRGTVRPTSVAITVGAALLALSVAAHRQVGLWHDSERLWRHGTAVVRNSFVGHNNLGEALDAAGHADAALAEFAKTLAIRPDDAMALNNTGVIHMRRGDVPTAKAYLRRAIQRDPGYAPTYVHLGNLYAREGRLDDALLMYRQIVKREPEFVNGLHNLAITLAQKGEYAEAIAHWRRALAIDPRDADVRHHLGVALLVTGKSAEGIEQLRAALEVKPDRADTLTRLAWVLATHPREEVRRPGEAVEMARRAVELGGMSPDPNALDALAAAQAAAGQFPAAAETADRALSAARAAADPDPALIAALESRRQRYLEGRPFVQGQ